MFGTVCRGGTMLHGLYSLLGAHNVKRQKRIKQNSHAIRTHTANETGYIQVMTRSRFNQYQTTIAKRQRTNR